MAKTNPLEAVQTPQLVQQDRDEGLTQEKAADLAANLKKAGDSYPVLRGNSRFQPGKASFSSIPPSPLKTAVSEKIRQIVTDIRNFISKDEDIQNFIEEILHNELGIFHNHNSKSPSSVVFSEDNFFQTIKFSLSRDFGLSDEAIETQRDLIAELASHFLAASGQNNAQSDQEPTEAIKPLTIPQGIVERYQGKKKSGEIYGFLQRVYRHEPDAQPLTLAYLKSHDPAALAAFRGRRRIVEIPADLLVLTDREWGTKQSALLKRHGVDLSTPEGVEAGKRLMGALGNLLYPRS